MRAGTAAGWLLQAASGSCWEAAAGARSPEPARRSCGFGYFANVTHAPAIVALEKGFLASELGPGVKRELRTFNAGPEAVEAIFSDALDIAYSGPNPPINALAQAKGAAIRSIAGATSGGAALVVKPAVTAPAQLNVPLPVEPGCGYTLQRRARRRPAPRPTSPIPSSPSVPGSGTAEI